MDSTANVQKRKKLKCPDCGGHQLALSPAKLWVCNECGKTFLDPAKIKVGIDNNGKQVRSSIMIGIVLILVGILFAHFGEMIDEKHYVTVFGLIEVVCGVGFFFFAWCLKKSLPKVKEDYEKLVRTVYQEEESD